MNKIDSDRLRGRIKDHFLTYGHKRWKTFERPESISYSMFCRYKREVRDDLIRRGLLEPKGGAKPLAEPEDVKRVQEVAKAADIKEIELAKPINLMSQVDRMLGICDMLDRDAVDEESGELRDVSDAREAIKTRASVLKLAVDAQDKLFSIDRMIRLQKITIERIKQADPQTAYRILRDIEAIDGEFGISLL